MNFFQNDSDGQGKAAESGKRRAEKKGNGRNGLKTESIQKKPPGTVDKPGGKA